MPSHSWPSGGEPWRVRYSAHHRGPLPKSGLLWRQFAVYNGVATSPAETFRFSVNPSFAHQFGSPDDLLQSLSLVALEPFTGVACPVRAAHPIDGSAEGSHNGASQDGTRPISRHTAHLIPEG